MSSIIDVSSKLGEYMLRGWVLTDKSCPTRGCNVPLMRSPNGQTPVTHFCANCDGAANREQGVCLSYLPSETSSNASSHSRLDLVSRSSTPPTEVSSTLSSPTFALPPETLESRRRREQSDQASTEIGNRLLKGWAMLADECPSSQCYGIPLIRPPKTGGGEKDPRKECVICGSIYLSEVDQTGRERLVPFVPDNPTPTIPTIPVSPASEHPRSNVMPMDSLNESRVQLIPVRTVSQVMSSPAFSTAAALDSASRALELTLLSMSERLTTLTSNPTLADPTMLGSISDTIGKSTQALSEVKKLQQTIFGRPS
ncbi:hypothetical protein K435DRAFT_641811 [Dendrothele bispora CBS 962.96]|uniref:Sjogrens syndrome scleroderma autoantigen 1 family protein n=1 Tax=Dendrothele bispora (strain CBS 962.96) TaxID=1314807 RepID=A0A4S8MYV6_DENBC|nr:hypothetical protein K435DRAFT_641811 [Dendrothele bispora CBS 962.96]